MDSKGTWSFCCAGYREALFPTQNTKERIPFHSQNTLYMSSQEESLPRDPRGAWDRLELSSTQVRAETFWERLQSAAPSGAAGRQRARVQLWLMCTLCALCLALWCFWGKFFGAVTGTSVVQLPSPTTGAAQLSSLSPPGRHRAQGASDLCLDVGWGWQMIYSGITAQHHGVFICIGAFLS